MIMLTCSMHVLFNFRVESLFYKAADLGLNSASFQSVKLLSKRVWERRVSHSSNKRVMAVRSKRVISKIAPEPEPEP
jgi:hypothetical protein